MRIISSRGLSFFILYLVGIICSIQTLSVLALPVYPIDGSISFRTLQANQVGRTARNATMTIQIGGLTNGFPALNNTSTQCFNQPGPGPAYAYSIFLDSSSINMSQCEAYNGTEIIRQSGAFIIDPFTAFTTKATPTQIANAMVAKGTLGTAFTITSNGGREVIFTRTNSNDGNIGYVDSNFASSDAFRVVNVVSGQSPLSSLVQQSEFVPANVGSGEVYLIDIDGYTYTYTAQASDGVSSVTAGLVQAYNVAPVPNVNCVDQTTRVFCSGNTDAVRFNINGSVTYPNADTIAPIVTLVGSSSITVAYGSMYSDSGATWIDNRDGTGTILSTSGSVDTNVLGTYILEYKKIDTAGNSGSVTRTVRVADLTPPVVTLIGPTTLTHELDIPYSDSGATWTDDIDGSGSFVASGALFASTGTYTFTYTKTDAAGNTGSASRSVIVIDTIPPLLTVTTPYTVVNASVYQISGNTIGASLVEISSGSTVLASMAPVRGYFSLFVPLTPNTRNIFTVTASDGNGNVGTGQAIVTSSGSIDAFSGALTVSGSTLSGAVTYSGVSFAQVNQITLISPVAFASGSGSGIIPNGTVVTNASGGTFDPSAINALVVTASGLASNQISQGALEFGISNVGLNFSKPVKIQIPVPGYTSSTITVKVKHGGTSTYVTTGLTNNPNAICTNGVATSPSEVATVELGIATIYTCAGSTFVAYTETAPQVSSGGGGGGSMSSSFTTTPITITPAVSSPAPTVAGASIYTVTPKASKVSPKRGFVVDITPITGENFNRFTRISLPTSFPEDSRVSITYIGKNGKKIQMMKVRVKDGMIQFSTKKAGTYQMMIIK